MHPRSNKMYNDLKPHHWWSGMKGDIIEFISNCLILLQAISILKWKRECVTMDFVRFEITSQFWSTLHEDIGTRLSFNVAFHLEMID
ncbi:integrase [Gossypium australe]|uniref:Integrase n=1 Tax=Gossypium australe TaxID=47621 RepID=A0A5B6W9Z2_9ROSI|nr:integrase [Gossypium australe]